MKRKMLTFLSVIFAIVTVMAVVVSCAGPDRESGAEAGTYYCDSNGTEYNLVLGDKCTFVLEIASEKIEGKYLLDGETLTLTPDKGDAISATWQEDSVTLVYHSTTYRFLKKIAYTVSFMNGSALISTESVINGKSVSKPQSPVKEGAVFIAWYTDSEFRSVYDFGQPVTSDLRLYARFVDRVEPEYEITFYVDGDESQFDPVQTIGGKVFGLPTPRSGDKEFAGWWVSHFQSADKLTYRYEEQQLFENTTLYAVWKSSAPLISITENGVSWSADGLNNSFVFKFVGPDGRTITESNGGTTSYAYNFAANAEGEYMAEVSLNGATARAYYNNKALARASVFNVEANTLIWNEIPGAEQYHISYACATAGHTHQDVVCADASYDFSDCDMPEGGFVFTVKAEAAGRAASEATYTFTRTLGALTGISVDPATELVSWSAVEKATGYYVDIRLNGKSVDGFPKNVGNVTSFGLKEYARGNYEISVYPVARGWLSPGAVTTTFDKTRLNTPSNIIFSGSTITWNEVEGASGYEVEFNGKVYKDIKTAVFELKEEYHVDGQDSYNFTVRAIDGSDPNGSSLPCDVFIVRTGETIAEAQYENGRLMWDAVWGAYGYVVKVNDGQEISVETNYFDGAVFTKEGDNELYVSIRLPDGTHGEWTIVTVTAYAVYFNVGTGHDTTQVATVYKAYGDPFSRSDYVTTRFGYDFIDWFTAEDAGRVYDDTVFGEHSNLTLYAHWTPKAVTVTFVVETGMATEVEQRTYYYEQPYDTMPVPEMLDNEYAFLGWYDQGGTAGMRYADYEGKATLDSFITFGNEGQVTLYAHFEAVFEWYEITEGANKGWRVSKRRAVSNSVAVITIPYEHEGQAVTEVSNFSGMINLKIVNIPDTIKTISLAAATAAFRDCSSLEQVNIYHVEDPKYMETNPMYSSYNGALYQTTEGVGEKLVLVPVAYSGTFEIKDGADTIPSNAFSGISQITEIVVPGSVATIEAEAITRCSSLAKITFREGSGDTAAQSLTISSRAFYNLTRLESIQFPTRLSSFDPGCIEGCSALVDIIVGNNDGTGSSGGYTSSDGLLCKILDSGLELIYVPLGRTELTLSTRFVSIGDGAFGMTDNGGTANTRIRNLTIPASVTNIGKNAFRGATGVTSLVFNGNDSNDPLTIKEYAFYEAGSAFGGFTELTLPENLQTLGAHAFGGTAYLTTVTVESSKLKAGATQLDFAASAFGSTDNKYYVQYLTLGKNVPSLNISEVFGPNIMTVTVDPANENFASYNDDGVLYNKNVTSIAFYPKSRENTEYVTPDTLTEIGANTFNGYTNLTKITIGSSVTSIGNRAFYMCSSLQDVIFTAGGNQPLTIGEEAFSGNSAPRIATIELPDRTTAIGANAFAGTRSLTSVTIPSTLETFGGEYNQNAKVGNSVFNNTYGLTEIKVKTIEGKDANWSSDEGVLYKVENGEPTQLVYAPMRCAVKEVKIPGTVTEIWSGAFYSNYNIVSLDFEEHEGGEFELTIGSDAFYNCYSLRTMALPEGLQRISSRAFYNCNGLQEIILPTTVQFIDAGAFANCSSLQSVKFRGALKSQLELADARKIEGNTVMGVFYNDKRLTSFEFIEGLTKIGTQAFRSTSLEEAQLPSTLNSIEADAFNGVQTLKSVTFANDSKLQYISDYAFYGCTGLTSIELPDSVTQIYAYAFARSGLQSIKLSKNLSTLGGAKGSMANSATGNYDSQGYVFTGSQLAEVEFDPDSKIYIGYGAFSNTQLVNVEFPVGLQYVGISSFSGISTLKSVKFADNTVLTGSAALQAYCFSGCINLTEVDFGKDSTIKLFATMAFYGCSSLEKIVIPAATTNILDQAFSYCTNLKTVEWEKDDSGKTKVSNLTNIGQSQLAMQMPWFNIVQDGNVFRATAITSIEFPESTNNIKLEPAIFNQCSKLKTITLSKSVNSLNGAFRGCSSLTNIYVDEENPYFSTDENHQTLLDKAGKSVYLICSELTGTYKIAEGATTIAEGAFAGQTKLEVVEIPSTVTSIGERAFEDCIRLTEVKFAVGSALNAIGPMAFRNCTALAKINFENTTMLQTVNASSSSTFGSGATLGTFYNCTSLDTIDLSNCNSLTVLRDYMFYGSGVKTVKFPARLTNTGSYTFQNCTRLETVDFGLCTDLTTIGTYAFAGSGVQNVTLPHGLTDTGTYTFQNCTRLATVNFSNCVSTLRTIGNYAFSGCSSLGTVALENCDGLTTIGTYAFQGCSSLQSFTFPATLTAINANAFQGCAMLQTVDLTDTSVSVINASVFQDCAALRQVQLPTAITSIGNNAFQNVGLTAIDLSDKGSLTTIGAGAFQDCAALGTVSLPATLTSIGNNAFQNCVGLTAIDLSGNGSLTTIGASVFQGCTTLGTVTLPANLTSIGASAFADCSGLRTITLTGLALTTIGANAFNGAGLTSVVIPKTVTTINAGAFANCVDLASVTFEGDDSEEKTALYINGPVNITDASATEGANNLGAFANTAITSISFKTDREIYLNSGAFANATKLQTITDWGNVKNVSSFAFYNSGLTSVTLPADLKMRANTAASFTNQNSVAQYIFAESKALASIAFDDGFTEIYLPDYFAQNCVALTTVDFTNAVSLKHIGNYAFFGCGLLGSKETLDLSALKDLTAIGGSINLSAQTAGLPGVSTNSYAFADCVALETVKIPENVTYIGAYAFYGCTELQTVEGFDKLTLVGNYAFANTDFRTNVTDDGDPTLTLSNPLATIGTYAFSGCNFVDADLSLCTLINSLAEGLFSGCEKLTTVELPHSLTTIGNGTFSGCVALNKVENTESLSTVMQNAFSGCTLLDENGISLANVASLGEYAFKDTAFKKYTIGTKLTAMASNVFDGCDITIEGAEDNPQIVVKDGFLMNGDTIVKALPAAVVDGVIKTPENAVLGSYIFEGITATRLEIADGVTNIPADAFNGSEITEIVIPNSVTTIANYAFRGANFKKVTIPTSVTSVANYMFAESNVEEVEFLGLPDNLASVSYLFYNSAVQSVKLPDTLETIGTSWFSGATQLTEVNMPSALKTIGYSAFQNTALVSIELPAGLESMPAAANSAAFTGSALQSVTIKGNTVFAFMFYGADKLSQVTFNDQTLSEIGASAFMNCTALTSITLPTGIKLIGENAFNGSGIESIDLREVEEIDNNAFTNSMLKNIVIPESVIEMGTALFSGCTQLVTAEFKNTWESDLPQDMFKDCAQLTSVVLPNGLMGLSANNFAGCVSLKKLWIPSSVMSIQSTAFTGWTSAQTICLEMNEREFYIIMSSTDWVDEVMAKVEFGVSSEAFAQKA